MPVILCLIQVINKTSCFMLITQQINSFLAFNSSWEFVFLSVINNCQYFGSKKCYLYQARRFYKKVLYQRIITWNNLFYRARPIVFYIHNVGRVFPVAVVNRAYHFVLAFYSGRRFPAFQVYTFPVIQTF